MKTLRTRNDIFAAINRRIVEIEEGNFEPAAEVIDCQITAGAHMIRAIEGVIRRDQHEKHP